VSWCFISFEWKAKVAEHFEHSKDEDSDICSLEAEAGDELVDASILPSRRLDSDDSCKDENRKGEEETEDCGFVSGSGVRVGEASSPDDVVVTPKTAVEV